MRHYEMMVILSDSLDDEGAQSLGEWIGSLIASNGGEVRQVDAWGRRPFAYEIAHRSSGYYLVYDLEAPGEGLPEIERQLKIHDDVIRFKVIRPEVRVRQPKQPRIRRPA